VVSRVIILVRMLSLGRSMAALHSSFNVGIRLPDISSNIRRSENLKY